MEENTQKEVPLVASRRLRAYYAHHQGIYGTAREARDIVTLRALGWDVENPSSLDHQQAVARIRDEHKTSNDASQHVMEYFKGVVTGCDIVAFRSFPDGAVGAGVAAEINWMIDAGKPVVELPSNLFRRGLSPTQTRSYLAELG